MNIAVLGAGNIGSTIGERWQRAGHEVRYGVRDPEAERYRDLVSRATVVKTAEALQSAGAVLLAIPGGTLEQVLNENASLLDGRIILDATNRLGGDSMHQTSLFQRLTPNAQVYRAFNTLGWENFAEPVIAGQQADLFYAGPEAERATVEGLIADVGLRPVYVGDGEAAADTVDGVARLWFALALGQGRGRHLAFRMLDEVPLHGGK